MKTIILPVTEKSAVAQLGHYTLMLAAAYHVNAHILFMRPDPRTAIPLLGEGLPAATIQTLCDDAEREGQENATRFQNIIASAGPDTGFTFEARAGLISDHAGRRARLADLAIAEPPKGGDPAAIFEDLLFRSGKPVLIVPADAPTPPYKHMMIAWNGRSEAARALSQALDLVQPDMKVTLLQIGDLPNDRPDIADAATYLKHYGVDAQLERLQRSTGAVGPIILETAARLSVDLLVIGAYSHARWREMIVGGVTRDIIAQAQLPVFLSH